MTREDQRYNFFMLFTDTLIKLHVSIFCLISRNISMRTCHSRQIAIYRDILCSKVILSDQANLRIDFVRIFWVPVLQCEAI